MIYYTFDADGWATGWIDQASAVGRSDWTAAAPPAAALCQRARWDGTGWTLYTDPAALDRLAQAVNAHRDRLLAELRVTVDGLDYDADPPSRDNLGGLLTASAAGVPVPWPIPWRCADDVVRPLSHAGAVALSGAILQAIQAVYAASWALKDAVIPSLSPAEAAAFDVTGAAWWPGVETGVL